MDDVVEEELTEQAVRAFIEGYRSKRTFSEEQLASMPLMRKIVSLQEYATILHVLSEPAEEEPEWMTEQKLAVHSEDELKEEIKDLNEKLSELNEEELAQAVGGGISPSINAF